ncbi:MAG: type I restriction endonuclease subunit R, partial [Halanaerobiales bacterium]
VKMSARYQQYRAVTKAMERIKEAERLKDRSGTIWHTQGSGKSLTMLFLSLKLKRAKELGNPTLLIVTDRVDLDEQISGTFKRCGFPNPVQAKSVSNLKELLKSEAGRTILTTIHKFQEYEKEEYPLLSKDTNIFVMADEAHRTQFKDLANNMRLALPNACYLGFTGTPIDKETKSTIQTFGDYIDTYTIEESVADGATLPIKYEGRLPELHVEGRDLDKIFEREFINYSDEEKKIIKEKYATERDIASASSRIEKICLDIIEHYESKIAPLKAQIVTVSREAAAKYKEAMDRLNGPESAVIISGDNNDKEIIKRYITTSEQRKKLVERFKDKNSSLRFIIVCDMLLTGFDAPVEQVMYLDKSLKEHNLLQAIARVNRVYEEKNYGLIVDYYGVFDYLKEALAIFNTQDVKNTVTHVRDEKPRLEANYRAVMRYFQGVNTQKLDECIDAFADEDKRARFKKDFKTFAKSMDIVMPDPIGTPYRDDLKFLGKVYRGVRNRYRDDNLDIKGVGDKVKRLIDEHIRVSDIKILNEPVSILNKEKFNQVLDETKTEKAKASEMEHAIKDEISVKMDENPVFYQSLKERLEEIIDKRIQGRLNFTEQIEQMHDIIYEIRNVRTKAEKLGFNEKEFALYELLIKEIEKEPQDKVAEGGATYNIGDSNDVQVNQKIKELTQKIMSQIVDLTKIDLWHEKNMVLQKMRKRIKLSLINYNEYRTKLDALTTKILKLVKDNFA